MEIQKDKPIDSIDDLIVWIPAVADTMKDMFGAFANVRRTLDRQCDRALLLAAAILSSCCNVTQMCCLLYFVG